MVVERIKELHALYQKKKKSQQVDFFFIAFFCEEIYISL